MCFGNSGFIPLFSEQQPEQIDLDALGRTIVYSIADEVEYNTALGINNLIITVRTHPQAGQLQEGGPGDGS